MCFFSLQQLWALKMPFLSISMFDVIEIRPRFQDVYFTMFYHVLPINVQRWEKKTSAFLYLFGFPDFSNFSLLIASSRQSSCFAGSLRIHFDIIGPLWNSDMFRLHDILFVGASWCYLVTSMSRIFCCNSHDLTGNRLFPPSTGFI